MEDAIIFVSKPVENGESLGYTLRFNPLTMELTPTPEDPECPFEIEEDVCSNASPVRVDTKYIPDYDFQLTIGVA